VTDRDERGGGVLEQRFEPEDRVDVQVVRRLVEQEDIGRLGQLARDGEPGAPAPRQEVGRDAGVREPALRRVSVTRRCRSWSSSRPSTAIAPATISAADIPVGKTGVCGTWPMRRFFRRLQVPESGLSTPARILKSVDLPAPLGPTSPT